MHKLCPDYDVGYCLMGSLADENDFHGTSTLLATHYDCCMVVILIWSFGLVVPTPIIHIF